MGLVPVLPTFVQHPHNHKVDYHTLYHNLDVICNYEINGALTSEVCTSAMSFFFAGNTHQRHNLQSTHFEKNSNNSKFEMEGANSDMAESQTSAISP
jgi:hypothetical protein